MPTSTIRYAHPTAAPSWAKETTSSEGMEIRYHWTAHYSDTAKLTEPGPNGEVLTEALLFGFHEDGEPPQVFLRILSADDSSVENDLTAEQTDDLIAAAEEWLTKVRGFRAQMGGGR